MAFKQTQHLFVVSLSLHLGFVNKKKNIEYDRTYPLTFGLLTVSDCDMMEWMKSPLVEGPVVDSGR